MRQIPGRARWAAGLRWCRTDYRRKSVMLLMGLAGVVIIALIVAMVLTLRRHRQTAELQQHFHSAYDEGARWNSLEDAENPIDQ